mgnify:CR=1 FL=1
MNDFNKLMRYASLKAKKTEIESEMKEIENHLFIINTKNIEKSLTYAELMAKPKLLKRNYFDFG